jgi:hypothetical protein
MSAAAGPANDTGVGANLQRKDKEIQQFLHKELQALCSSDRATNRKYMLVFSIRGHAFKIPLQIKNSKEGLFTIDLGTGSRGYLDNCIYIQMKCEGSGFKFVSSIILKDSHKRKCFDPMLSTESLTFGITQLDILTTLSTKIKLILVPTYSEITDNLIIGETFQFTYLSVYRLLCGEKTPYEKYGYASKVDSSGKTIFETIRHKAKTTTFNTILTKLGERNPHDRQVLLDFLRETYDGIFTEENLEKPIAEIMKAIKYDDIHKEYAWANDVFFLLTDLNYEDIEDLRLDPTSEVWRAWDQSLNLVSLTPMTSGGRRSRRIGRKNRRCYSRRR